MLGNAEGARTVRAISLSACVSSLLPQAPASQAFSLRHALQVRVERTRDELSFLAGNLPGKQGKLKPGHVTSPQQNGGCKGG